MTPELLQDQWKEINAHTRHWEALVFDNAKTFLNLVALALGAAGAVVLWPSVSRFAQLAAIALFLIAASAFSVCAIKVITSIQNYLQGFYARRESLEHEDLRLRDEISGAGRTLPMLKLGFVVAILISLSLLLVAFMEPPRSTLEGARLPGADLSTVSGLSQRDLEGACGDSLTKLPTGLTLRHCPSSALPKVNAQPGAAAGRPQAAGR